MSDSTLLEIVASLNKKHGDGAVQLLGASPTMSVETVSSGSLTLDNALGGGFAVGRVIEIIGPESSGKTTITLHAVREFQHAGKAVAFIDAEHALDPAYAKAIGVDVDSLLVAQPDHGEQALDIVEDLVRSGKFGLVIVDSVANLTPKAEIEGKMGDAHVGLLPRLMSQAMRKLDAIANKSKTTLIFINQIRSKIGVPAYMNPETTPGGNALKFYASQRLDVRRKEKIEQGKIIVGNEILVKVIKNKIAPPFRQAELEIRYGEGIDRFSDILNTAIQLGFIKKTGSFFALGDIKLQGYETMRLYLKDHPEVFDDLKTSLTSIDYTTGTIS